MEAVLVSVLSRPGWGLKHLEALSEFIFWAPPWTEYVKTWISEASTLYFLKAPRVLETGLGDGFRRPEYAWGEGPFEREQARAAGMSGAPLCGGVKTVVGAAEREEVGQGQGRHLLLAPSFSPLGQTLK